MVAPVRERGLKFIDWMDYLNDCSRSREGAWIEIGKSWLRQQASLRRSREGAWIEMLII